MLRITALRFPAQDYDRDEVASAFKAAELGTVRIPGRRDRVDAHDVRGLFLAYLRMAGATLAGPDAEDFEVPENARPFVEALRKAYERLVGPDASTGSFRIEPSARR